MHNWRALSATLMVTLAATLGANSVAARPVAEILQSAALAERLTGPQNAERARVGVRPLTWDPALEKAAADYAAELARTGKWGHSAPEQRVGQGENLWMGTRDAFSLEEMLDGWLTERSMFRRGTFPHVTTSASWHDVGHYTQIIWADTLRVGCAVRSSPTFDYLVCRYSEPGNVMGQRVGPVTVASR